MKNSSFVRGIILQNNGELFEFFKEIETYYLNNYIDISFLLFSTVKVQTFCRKIISGG